MGLKQNNYWGPLQEPDESSEKDMSTGASQWINVTMKKSGSNENQENVKKVVQNMLLSRRKKNDKSKISNYATNILSRVEIKLERPR